MWHTYLCTASQTLKADLSLLRMKNHLAHTPDFTFHFSPNAGYGKDTETLIP